MDRSNKDDIIDLDGKICIENGKINVINPKEGGRPAKIANDKSLKLTVNGEEIKIKKEVFENDHIEVILPENISTRNLDINVSLNKMEAYMDISYEPQLIYEMKCKPKEENIYLIYCEISEKKFPPKFSMSEIEKELISKGIICGIIIKNIKDSIKEDKVNNVLVAKGRESIDGKNDMLKLNFNMDKNFKKDSKGNVDYKSIGDIQCVKAGEILGEIVIGQEGINGVNVFGKIIKAKKKNTLKIKCNNGCAIEENKIVALIDGRPQFKNNIFEVSEIYEVKRDVDLSTGNIKFDGTVVVYGSVTEGMKVEGGAGIEIYKNVSGAEVVSTGNIIIGGNILYSKVACGGEDNINIKLKKDLNILIKLLKEVRLTTEKVLKSNLLGRKARDGEVIKILLENKFKNIPDLLISIERSYVQKGSYRKFVEILKDKLIGLGPLSIENYENIANMESIIEKEIICLHEEKIQPMDIEFRYAQNSNIKASGDVYIVGKGEYISEITSNGGVYFNGINSVARGGIIKGKKEIKCKFVGSDAGVSTKLQVDNGGEIWADVAYQNTKFMIGNLERNIEHPCKDVHVYLDSKGELVVDTLRL